MSTGFMLLAAALVCGGACVAFYVIVEILDGDSDLDITKLVAVGCMSLIAVIVGMNLAIIANSAATEEKAAAQCSLLNGVWDGKKCYVEGKEMEEI